MANTRTGLLLLNLGTPRSADPADVRRYLKQFLNDPYVIDIPAVFRRLLVDGIILNTRPKRSAEAYSKVWTERGSPLLFHTEDLLRKVRSRIGDTPHPPSVRMAMRYGDPSIRSALEEFRKEGVEDLVFLPLYPQYSYAATESSIVEFERLQREVLPGVRVRVIEDFFHEQGFIRALARKIAPVWNAARADRLLLTYHGVPERQLTKVQEPPRTCGSPGCCDTWGENNLKCYRAQSYETSRRLGAALGLDPQKCLTSFQSRLGRTKWIEPYTDFILKDLPAQGVKRLVVVSPSFTADCLETLEEIQMQYRELFLESGGEYFEYVPCLNSDDDFAAVLVDISRVCPE
jgi:ferrochelatase